MFIDFVVGVLILVVMMYAAVCYPVFFWVTIGSYFGIDVYDNLRLRSR
jgi:hypothetical protein